MYNNIFTVALCALIVCLCTIFSYKQSHSCVNCTRTQLMTCSTCILWGLYQICKYFLPNLQIAKLHFANLHLPILHFTKLFLCKLTIYQIHLAKLTYFRFLENLQISFILPNLHSAKPSVCSNTKNGAVIILG